MSLDRIVVGVDGSKAGEEALRQAVQLLPEGGRLLAVVAYDPALATRAGWDAPTLVETLREDAEAARAGAERLVEAIPGAEARIVTGPPVAALLEAAERERADAIAVGSHGVRRTVGIVLGSVATAMLHRAPCPVFVARGAEGAESAESALGRGVVVGVDGSQASAEAYDLALELARRLGAPFRALVATGGKPVEIERLRAIADLEWDERGPVAALVAASREAGLVVVGSRGLHGLGALGSVSERVAHRAACSVLAVRPATTGTQAA